MAHARLVSIHYEYQHIMMFLKRHQSRRDYFLRRCYPDSGSEINHYRPTSSEILERREICPQVCREVLRRQQRCGYDAMDVFHRREEITNSVNFLYYLLFVLSIIPTTNPLGVDMSYSFIACRVVGSGSVADLQNDITDPVAIHIRSIHLTVQPMYKISYILYRIRFLSRK